MNVRTPFNPPGIATTWPKVEQSIAANEEAKAIEAYLQAIDKKAALRPDWNKGRRR